jgi:hypothetical protein
MAKEERSRLYDVWNDCAGDGGRACKAKLFRNKEECAVALTLRDAAVRFNLGRARTR